MRPELERLLWQRKRVLQMRRCDICPWWENGSSKAAWQSSWSQRLKEGGEIEPMLAEMEWCLKENRPYYAEPGRCG